MGVEDRIGFYLLPRSKAKLSTPSPKYSQSRFPPIDADQSTEASLSSRSDRSTGKNHSRIRKREERKQNSLIKDIPNLELRRPSDKLLPQRPRTRTNRLSKTPEVLFESTPLYSPKDQTESIPTVKVK